MINQISDEEFNKCFKMKPEEIVEYFEAKGLKPSFDWHEVYEDAHAKAFTVAKMTELDLLKDTKDLLQKSLDEGKSYSSFKKEAMELFNRKGWTGRKEVIDPNTGETKEVELGTPRRVKLIYDCNMNSAYSIGRYKEMLEEADVAPYWQYKSLMDGRERPEHRALHNKVFKCTDPFWSVFFPPNGFRCRCYVANLTKREVEKQGLKVESSEGKIKDTTIKAGEELRPTKSYTFNHDGRKITMTPDAGWGTNLGIQAWGIDVQAWNKVKDMPEAIKLRFISLMAENPYKEAAIAKAIETHISILKKGLNYKSTDLVINWIKPDIFEKLIENNIKPITPIISFETQQVKHSLGKGKVQKQALTEDQFKQLYQYIDKPAEIFLDIEDPAIIFVVMLPEEEVIDRRNCIKIPAIINQEDNKRPPNYIGTTGRVNYQDTFGNSKKYKKLK